MTEEPRQVDGFDVVEIIDQNLDCIVSFRHNEEWARHLPTGTLDAKIRDPRNKLRVSIDLVEAV